MNLFASFLRTLVPILAGLLLGLAARVGLHLDDATVTTAVTAGLTAAYYAVFRSVEALTDRLGGPAWLQTAAGILLGYARPPEYKQPVTVPLQVRLQLANSDEFARTVRDITARRRPDSL
ncbi:hypothetical protein [Streptomyces sp. NPDC002644]